MILKRLGAVEEQTRALEGFDAPSGMTKADIVDQRIGGISGRVDKLADRIAGVETRLDRYANTIATIGRKVDGLMPKALKYEVGEKFQDILPSVLTGGESKVPYRDFIDENRMRIQALEVQANADDARIQALEEENKRTVHLEDATDKGSLRSSRGTRARSFQSSGNSPR
jgi:hypothetical protein